MEQADDPLTRSIIGAAIAVHKALGPGLLESAYETCLAHELRLAGHTVVTSGHCRSTTAGFRSSAPIGLTSLLTRLPLWRSKPWRSSLPSMRRSSSHTSASPGSVQASS